MPDEVLTINEVATLLKVAEKTVYAMPQTGEIRASRSQTSCAAPTARQYERVMLPMTARPREHL